MSEARGGRRAGRRVTIACGITVVLIGGGRVLLTPVRGGVSHWTASASTAATAASTKIRASALSSTTTCTGAFETHLLDHTTTISASSSAAFDSNGSGVADDDLDDDGRIDIVLGNLDGPDTILWNEGNWRFTTQRLHDRSTRAVGLVDVDGDGNLDIVDTHRAGGVGAWRNLGDRTFTEMRLTGVLHSAYSMAWADVDGNGTLDVATGSFDAELDQQSRSTFLFSDGEGIFTYLQKDGAFHAERLATKSEALTTNFVDLDLDGRPDLLIGNDFSMRDAAWRNTDDGWKTFEPFSHTATHTMSFDAGDVDNDGAEEYFSTDMKPRSPDAATLAQWLPLMASLQKPVEDPSNPQRVANVLEARQANGKFSELAEQSGVDATGWSWSGRFGDLDNDGSLDLYVVNGMMGAGMFPYLAGTELVEKNVALSNRGDGSFTARPEWHLDSEASGRGSVMADLDNDGRLDVVVNNVGSPAAAYENRVCGGQAVEVALNWPGSKNTRAIGAHVEVTTSKGTMVREVRAGGGYLSGSSSRLHVGLPANATLQSIRITWPDRSMSMIADPASQTLYEVTRS